MLIKARSVSDLSGSSRGVYQKLQNPSVRDLEGTLVDELCKLSRAANWCTGVLKNPDEGEIAVRPHGAVQAAVPRS